MSIRHPIISITGSSGAGHHHGQAHLRADLPPRGHHRRLHRGRRLPPLRPRRHARRHRRGDRPAATTISAISAPRRTCWPSWRQTFESYGRTGTGRTRHYVHDQAEADKFGCPPGTFTPWTQLPSETDVLFYEGLHGAVVTDTIDIAQHADLKIGVVPVINLEWIQKIHRDRASRGYSVEAVTDTILRRMPDYVNYICPQFGVTDINFQRVPTVDTSNPFMRPLDSHPRRIDGGDPLRQSARHRLLLPGLDDPRQLHVAGQLHRHSRQQARPGDAAHPHADDPQTGRAPAARGLKNRTETHNMTQVTTRDLANAVRALAMDAVEQAKSGHPGMPMGMADVATVLWTRFLRYDPEHPDWPDRDRFVLSAGHGSMLLYALLHLTGFPASTSPSSSASASSAPRPPAIRNTATRRGSRPPPARSARASPPPSAWRWPSACRRPGTATALVDHYTYVIAGDGCLMEGISHEAASLAGHLGLGRLIVLWDDNGISIDGPTSLDRVGKHPGALRRLWLARAVRRRPRCRRGGRCADGGARRCAALADRLQDRHRLWRADQGRARKRAWRAAGRGGNPRRARPAGLAAPRRSKSPPISRAAWQAAGARGRADRLAWETPAGRRRRTGRARRSCTASPAPCRPPRPTRSPPS